MLAALALATAQAIAPTAALPPTTGDPCGVFDKAAGGDAQLTEWTAGDQVRMADIGSPVGLRDREGFGISPDGQRVAFIIHRANPDANAYCLRLMVAQLATKGEAIEVARGGEFIQDDMSLRDFTSLKTGWAKPNQPRWSPSGSLIAFLRREGGSTQVWVADPSRTADPYRATDLPDDIDDFAWAPDGTGLVVSNRPGIRLKAEAIAREGRGGFRFDERFAPQIVDRPIPTGEVTPIHTWVSLTDSSTRPATEAEVSLLAPRPPDGAPAQASRHRTSTEGHSAWVEPKIPVRLLSPTRLVLATADGRTRRCDASACEGVRTISWSPSQQAFFMIRDVRETAQTALLRWSISDAAPRQVLLSDDVIFGCSPAGREFVCMREAATQPGRLVAIDMVSGQQRVIHDPNPAISSVTLGSVERLRFRLPNGVESFADLVLPPDHRPGQQHPLIVVQYRSRGFLRGGTGDEVPIFPLAARGFAVLSFDRPLLPEFYRATSEAEFRTLNRDPWADRRQVQAALEQAVQLALETGAVDAGRMGISGFSDEIGRAHV